MFGCNNLSKLNPKIPGMIPSTTIEYEGADDKLNIELLINDAVRLHGRVGC